MPTKARGPCSRCGRAATYRGLCDVHTKQAAQRRGTATERGYDSDHANRFAYAVLHDRHGHRHQCATCPALATDADHYPRTRRELVALGLDPNDPRYGRPLCHSCHSRHTAQTSIARRQRQ